MTEFYNLSKLPGMHINFSHYSQFSMRKTVNSDRHVLHNNQTIGRIKSYMLSIIIGEEDIQNTVIVIVCDIASTFSFAFIMFDCFADNIS